MDYDDAPEFDDMDIDGYMEDMEPPDEIEQMMAAQYEESLVKKKSNDDDNGSAEGGIQKVISPDVTASAPAPNLAPDASTLSSVTSNVPTVSHTAPSMASSDLSTASSSFTAYPGSIKGQYRTMNSLVTPGSSAARAKDEEKKLRKAQDMLKRIREGKARGAKSTDQSQAKTLLQLADTQQLQASPPSSSSVYSKTPVLGVRSFEVTLLDGTQVHVPTTRGSSGSTAPPRAPPLGACSGDKPDPNKANLLSLPMSTLNALADETLRPTLPSSSSSPSSSASSPSLPLAPYSSATSQLWVDKYTPATFSDLLSSSLTNREVLRAIRNWDPYVFKKNRPARPAGQFRAGASDSEADPDGRPAVKDRVILLTGPPGVGKTTLAHVVAKMAGYRVSEVNASDDRSAEALKDRVLTAQDSNTLNFEGGRGKPNLVILDEVDGAASKSAISALVRIISAPSTSSTQLRRPLIFVANSKYSPCLRPLLGVARCFDMGGVDRSKVVTRLKHVCSAESLVAPPTALANLVASSSGDIRSCLHTLQFVATHCRAAAGPGTTTVDIAASLGGSNKDGRSDMRQVQSLVFGKDKKWSKSKSGSKSERDIDAAVTKTDEVLRSVSAYTDPSKVLSVLFANLGRGPPVDPTLKLTALSREYLSDADSRGGKAEVAAAAAGLLCGGSGGGQEVLHTNRADYEASFRRSQNAGLLSHFLSGLATPGCFDAASAVQDLVPFALDSLGAGSGTHALNRSVTDKTLLSVHEAEAVRRKVRILRALGLTYVPEASSSSRARGGEGWAASDEYVLEPRVDMLADFGGGEEGGGAERRQDPNTIREMCANEARLEVIRERERTSLKRSQGGAQGEEEGEGGVEKAAPKPAAAPPATPKPQPAAAPKTPASGTPAFVSPSKPTTFLTKMAGRSKKSQNARRAAAVGFSAKKSKREKLAHTGSGELLKDVARYKHQKGFTQAVRVASKMQDFM